MVTVFRLPVAIGKSIVRPRSRVLYTCKDTRAGNRKASHTVTLSVVVCRNIGPARTSGNRSILYSGGLTIPNDDDWYRYSSYFTLAAKLDRGKGYLNIYGRTCD
jgi:hypothetical protein